MHSGAFVGVMTKPGRQVSHPVREFAYSVLIPAFDSASTISEAVRSALTQTLRPQRVFVIDDGSVDGTPDLARRAGAEVCIQPHGGSAAARNTGLGVVSTPFLATLDADDTWAPRMAETHARTWASLDEGVAATGAMLRPVGSSVDPSWLQRSRLGDDQCTSTVSPEELWKANPLPCSATMFRTAAIREVGGWAAVPAVEDYELLVRLWATGRELVRIPEVLGTYLVSPEQKTARVSRGLAGERNAISVLYGTTRRRAELPTADLDARLRKAWWRAAARCANYCVPISTLPPFSQYGGSSTRGQLSLARLLMNPQIGRFAAWTWRRSGRMRLMIGHFGG
jgi:glycosyltransferase involved in cell wall biosynthesis